jgi:chemotaxis regulatin CheY-phosphate phosphatase CheZ
MAARRPELSEEEYLEIEETLASNIRGRSFLRMRDQRARVVAVNDVRKLLREAKLSATKQAGASELKETDQTDLMRDQLREISAYIHKTRHDIASERSPDGSANRITSATGELEGIVSATEHATSEILTGVEHIQQLATELPKGGDVGRIVDAIQAQVTTVLTACSFQDLTGQRTMRVVNSLRYIEERVNSMIGIWGVEGDGASAAQAESQYPESGPSQADVDALFEQPDGTEGSGKAMEPTPAPAVPSNTQAQIDAIFGVTR